MSRLQLTEPVTVEDLCSSSVTWICLLGFGHRVGGRGGVCEGGAVRELSHYT